MPLGRKEMEYTTQTEATTFCNIFNLVDQAGRVATWERVAPGHYRVTIIDPPKYAGDWFFSNAKAAA